MGVKGVFPPPSTIYWLRDLLEKVGEINPYGFYQFCQEKAKAETDIREIARWRAVSYNSVRRLFYILSRLGLIEFMREEPGSRGGQPKRFYAMVPDTYTHWQSGLQVLFWPDTYWGGRRYRKNRGELLPRSEQAKLARKAEELAEFIGGE